VDVVRAGGPSKRHASKYNRSTASQCNGSHIIRNCHQPTMYCHMVNCHMVNCVLSHGASAIDQGWLPGPSCLLCCTGREHRAKDGATYPKSLKLKFFGSVATHTGRTAFNRTHLGGGNPYCFVC
jgi:hypothetical protein